MSGGIGHSIYPHVRTVTVQYQVEGESPEAVDQIAEMVADDAHDYPDTAVETVLDWQKDPDDTEQVGIPPKGNFKIWVTATTIENREPVTGPDPRD